MEVGEHHAFPGHLVDARRFDPAIVKAHIAAPQIVRQNHNDVGLSGRLGRGRARRNPRGAAKKKSAAKRSIERLE